VGGTDTIPLCYALFIGMATERLYRVCANACVLQNGKQGEVKSLAAANDAAAAEHAQQASS
jgi:hypothetical protein